MSNGLMLSFPRADRRALWLASGNSCQKLALISTKTKGKTRQILKHTTRCAFIVCFTFCKLIYQYVKEIIT